MQAKLVGSVTEIGYHALELELELTEAVEGFITEIPFTLVFYSLAEEDLYLDLELRTVQSLGEGSFVADFKFK